MYTYRFRLNELGYREKPIESYTECEIKAKNYTERWLSDSVKMANCGWDHVSYVVMENKSGREEFAVLHASADDSGERYYVVTGDSLGAIAEEIWKGVFR